MSDVFLGKIPNQTRSNLNRTTFSDACCLHQKHFEANYELIRLKTFFSLAGAVFIGITETQRGEAIRFNEQLLGDLDCNESSIEQTLSNFN